MIQRCNSKSGSITISSNSLGRLVWFTDPSWAGPPPIKMGSAHCDIGLVLAGFQGNGVSCICLENALLHPFFHLPLEITWRKAYLLSSLAMPHWVGPCLFLVTVSMSDASELMGVQWVRWNVLSSAILQSSVWVLHHQEANSHYQVWDTHWQGKRKLLVTQD